MDMMPDKQQDHHPPLAAESPRETPTVIRTLKSTGMVGVVRHEQNGTVDIGTDGVLQKLTAEDPECPEETDLLFGMTHGARIGEQLFFMSDGYGQNALRTFHTSAVMKIEEMSDGSFIITTASRSRYLLKGTRVEPAAPGMDEPQEAAAPVPPPAETVVDTTAKTYRNLWGILRRR